MPCFALPCLALPSLALPCLRAAFEIHIRDHFANPKDGEPSSLFSYAPIWVQGSERKVRASLAQRDSWALHRRPWARACVLRPAWNASELHGHHAHAVSVARPRTLAHPSLLYNIKSTRARSQGAPQPCLSSLLIYSSPAHSIPIHITETHASHMPKPYTQPCQLTYT